MLKSEWVWGEVRVVSWAIHDMNLCKILSINCPSGGCQRVCPCARMTHICLVHVGERVGGARVRMCVLHVMYLRHVHRCDTSALCVFAFCFYTRGSHTQNQCTGEPRSGSHITLNDYWTTQNSRHTAGRLELWDGAWPPAL